MHTPMKCMVSYIYNITSCLFIAEGHSSELVARNKVCTLSKSHTTKTGRNQGPHIRANASTRGADVHILLVSRAQSSLHTPLRRATGVTPDGV